MKNKEEFVKKHLYTIAENHPPQSFPWIVRENFNKTSLQFPEELLNDKEKREYFFEVLKNDNLKGEGFTHNFVFEKEQESLTEEDIIKIMLSQFDDFYITEIKSKLENSKLSFLEIINLASIVEKEALKEAI